MMGCGNSNNDDLGRISLLEKVNRLYESEQYRESRDSAESFIARFPQDEQIDVVRLKLLASYIYSTKYRMAESYADRLLQGSLMDELYYEDVEYYKIVLKIERSKHSYATTLKMKNIYRNFSELEKMLSLMENFLASYPNSAYSDELKKYRDDLRLVLAEHQLSIALHYAQKGNKTAMLQRLSIYQEKFSDVKTPLFDQVLAYQ